jgi:hypothetical protein
MWKYLEIFLLDVSPEFLESFFLGSPKSGLGVHYTPSLDELDFSVARLGGPTNGTMFHVIPEEIFSSGDQGNQHEGGSVGLHPQ